MHEVLVNRLGGLSLPRKSAVRLTDRPDMTLDVYRGRKTTLQHIQEVERAEEQCSCIIGTSNKHCTNSINLIRYRICWMSNLQTPMRKVNTQSTRSAAPA